MIKGSYRERDDLDRLDLRRAGTLAPFFRASDSPMAMACFRLLTFPPLPPGPDLRVPFFRRRMALSTRFDAAFPYRRLAEDFFFGDFLVAIDPSWLKSPEESPMTRPSRGVWDHKTVSGKR